MNSKINIRLCIIGLFAAIILSNCATARQYDFSLKNTLSIFLLNNGKNFYFCIPVQYMGDYQIEKFDFTGGNITIGDYEILLKINEVTISVYLNDSSDEDGSSDGEFNLIYLEENGRLLTSIMDEPLTTKQEPDKKLNHYYIFIERYLTNAEYKKIINEYKKGNVYSKLSIWYDMILNNEEQNGNGMLDDFELYNGPAIDPVWFPPNLNFFKARYLGE